MEKKYELTKDGIGYKNKTLYRIRALKDFDDVKKGDLGGYVENEHNLSHDGNCWVYDNAKVLDNGLISGNGKIFNNAEVWDNGVVYENARVKDNAKISSCANIYGNSEVYNNAEIYGCAHVFGNSNVYGNAEISDFSTVFDCASVYDNAHIMDNAWIFGRANISDNAKVSGKSKIFGDVIVYGNASISGKNVRVFGTTRINKIELSDDAYISSNKDFMYVCGLGSQNRTTYFYKTEDNGIRVVCGCFIGTIDDFRNKVMERYPIEKYGKEYIAMSYFAEWHLNNE